MFKVGELVELGHKGGPWSVSRYKKLGLVVEIKHLKSVQYCKVLWSSKGEQDWVCSDNLHEVFVKNN